MDNEELKAAIEKLILKDNFNFWKKMIFKELYL